MADWIGKTLGEVHIDSLLARGGMAEIYLGTHAALQRRVAVKILLTQFQDDPRFIERFQREARAVAMLRHPNIVQVYDFSVTDAQPYLVMEYLPGGTLTNHLFALRESNRIFGFSLVNRLLTSMAEALQYAHARGVVHRDIKPGNILMTSRTSPMTTGSLLPTDVEPVLTDFGLVRLLNSTGRTATLQIAGTPAYMSPEQARGEPADERTDIYSLGIVIYEIVAGRLPFEAETTLALLLKHVNEPPPPIPGLAPAMQNVIDRALAKNTADRFATPVEFATRFDAAVAGRTSAATFIGENPGLSRLPARTLPRRTSRRTWLAAAGSGVALLVLGAYLTLGGLTPQAAPTASAIPVEPLPLEATGTLAAPLLGPTGVLHFRHGGAIMDQVVLTAMAMPSAPSGGQYEVWLVGGKERLSLGTLSLDPNGKGTLSFTDSQGRNLLEIYDEVEITIEPSPDSNLNPSAQVAFSFSLPARALVHVRHLLVAFPGAPDRIALIQGLYAQTNLIARNADEMQRAYQKGDDAGARQAAESIMLLLVGDQSADYKDWNDDGQITESSDGYGLMLNGENSGYIQAVYAHSDYAAATQDATQYMIVYGEHVKICAQNLQQWASQLRVLVLAVLTSPAGSDLRPPIEAVSALANQMLNGADLDRNGQIEPILGECGVLTAYEHAYSMADMPLLPTNLSSTPGAASATRGANTPPPNQPTSAGLPPGATGPAVQPTKKNTPPGQDNVPPGQDKEKRPHPTHP